MSGLLAVAAGLLCVIPDDAGERPASTGSAPASITPTSPTTPSTAAESTSPPRRPSAEWDRTFARIVTSVLAPGYVDEKKWGKTKNLTVGIRLEQKGLVVRPRRRRKEVKHGTWERYEIHLADPNRPVGIKVTRIRQGEEVGKSGGMELDVTVRAPLRLHGRVARWERGVQLYNISADAEADVQVALTCRMQAKLDVHQFPPGLTLRPQVTRAKVQVTSFRLQRISDLHGPLVKRLGKNLRGVLNEQLRKKEPKLVQKINRQLDKYARRLGLAEKPAADEAKGKSD